MAKRTWKVALPDGEHVVDFEHGYISGARKLVVDGRPVVKVKRNVIDMGGDVAFQISGHPCAVLVKSNGITYSYDLEVDGKSVATGVVRGPSEKIQPLPGWAMLGVAACFAIPLVSLGGGGPAVRTSIKRV